ncbi:hypothetical protein [Candidatus Macondimonas diazotrophica]|jgi:hypothetical protein|uniref:Uncharacterized protein n=1 Tax=Candidatus Macondimonas diazotrophica TaxID=2305248 RepID=A0A4Z0FB64_9GAMM|nr:hypothetical protein [Candidatus Macondimonas diazotrophica]NCT99947.1 hypothetical protein [Candidatus Macondimonas diazotrophica]TFZ83746.1 hypothetical protein E4680_01830 [Candidatus Macondimonas diazotrophica]HBG29397.1 hypothetical protein [Gammaproteobacteria bacterium]HBG50940.1 hypothetical protein [Gammaproteobacteria bacterium]
MKKYIKMAFAGVALAGFSMTVSAGMSDLSDQDLRDVSGQAYFLNVGLSQYTAPFAYEVFSSKAPSFVVDYGRDLVSTYASGYPAKVSSARSAGLDRANMGLSAATMALQAIPFVGPLVPPVSISTAP